MSLVALLKTENSGFAFSDGAISTHEQIVSQGLPKITPINDCLILAVSGDTADSLSLGAKISDLGPGVGFEDVLPSLRAEIGRHFKRYGKIPRGNFPHKLPAALLGRDACGRIALVGWDGNSGEEKQMHRPLDNWFMAVNDEAYYSAGAQLSLALEVYAQHNDPNLFLLNSVGIFKQAARTFPRVGERVFWSAIGTGLEGLKVKDAIRLRPGGIRVEAATDNSGNLKLKNKEYALGSTSDPTTTSPSFSDLADMSVFVNVVNNEVLLTFTGSFSNNTAGQGGGVSFYRGSSQILHAQVSGVSANANDIFGLNLSYMDNPGPGSYTYKVRWYATGGTLKSVGQLRTLQAIELG